MKIQLLLLLTAWFGISASGQSYPPKFEFRAAWVATVANIDWPSKPGLTTEEQQVEIINILEMHKGLGMNAIILQIRPTSDAFYISGLEPWSRYLTGEPGKAPDPLYDPLHFWITEAHRRGMELHAWLNPYRVALNQNQPLAANHIAFTHPDWILKYGNSLYFDPGIPETRAFVTQVVKDIVTRYDVDAIHFDDYFYPYPLPEPFPDTTSFRLYSRGFFQENKADWRRENVDILIKMLNDTIKAVKPWVKFGISPFGVWRNIADDPNGSYTRAGVTNYDHLYADIIKWQEKGWIDYSLPQLYWQIGHPAADFETLAYWWKNHAYGKGMYIGIGMYKSDANSTVREWADPAELPRQIKLLRRLQGIDGVAYYSSKHFYRDLMGLQDSLKNDLYKLPALTPTMPWISTEAPQPVKRFKKRGRTIRWKFDETENELKKAKAFVVYLYKEGEQLNPENPEYIHVLAGKEDSKFKFERINRKREKYEVRISVINRLNNESWLSHPVKVRL